MSTGLPGLLRPPADPSKTQRLLFVRRMQLIAFVAGVVFAGAMLGFGVSRGFVVLVACLLVLVLADIGWITLKIRRTSECAGE